MKVGFKSYFPTFFSSNVVVDVLWGGKSWRCECTQLLHPVSSLCAQGPPGQSARAGTSTTKKRSRDPAFVPLTVIGPRPQHFPPNPEPQKTLKPPKAVFVTNSLGTPDPNQLGETMSMLGSGNVRRFHRRDVNVSHDGCW